MCPSPFGVPGLCQPEEPLRRVLSGVLGCGFPHHGISRGNSPAPGHVYPDMSAAAHLLTLPGGTRFTFRPIEAGDKAALACFFQRLSDESRRRRFLGAKPSLSKRDLTFLTEVDQRRHVALVALDAAGAIVAVARYAAWPGESDRAELAFAVVDEWHGRGLASALGDRLVAHARASGMTALTGSTFALNEPAKALLRRLGLLPTGISAGVAEFELRFGTATLPAAA